MVFVGTVGPNFIHNTDVINIFWSSFMLPAEHTFKWRNSYLSQLIQNWKSGTFSFDYRHIDYSWLHIAGYFALCEGTKLYSYASVPVEKQLIN